VSDNGTLVYIRGGFLRELVLVDRAGRETPVPVDARGYRFPRVSPDGRYLAATVDPRPSDLWIVDLERGSAVPQATEHHDGWGVWSPDGQKVAYQSGGLERNLWVRDFPFANPAVPIGGPDHSGLFPLSWALDDRLLASGTNEINAISVSDGSVELLIPSDEAPLAPRISPDGRWLAYQSTAAGVSEVYVVAYPDVGERHLVSRGGGADPSWSAEGTELFYRNGNSIMVVPVRTSPSFEVVGEPVMLFTTPYNFFQPANWTSRPQGDFVMIRSDPTSSTQIQVVQNWFTELCEKMGEC
jgi:Tol biopolymer transport system component